MMQTISTFAITAFLTLLAMNAGQAYQNQEDCKRITAAYADGGGHFLFFGTTYVTLDRNFTENWQGNSYYYFGVSWPDATFVWSLDHYAYFFSDKYYYSAWKRYLPVKAKYFGGKFPRHFFKDGLDAAGSLNGTTLFFKGCKYVVTPPKRPSDPTDLWNGVPCDLDAALTVGDDLWLFKYDKVWIMKPEGLAPGMPVDVSSVIHLKDITLCKEDNEDD